MGRGDGSRAMSRVDLHPATWLLECVLPDRDRDAVLGDLIEEYGLRLQSQPRAAASQWVWAQVLSSMPRLVWSALVAGKWYYALGIAIAVFIAIGALETAINVLLVARLPFSPMICMFLGIAVGLASLTFGGYLAAWLRPAAAIFFAAGQGLMGIALMITRSDAYPLWGQLVLLVLCTAASLAGGVLRIRGKRRARRPAP